MATTNNNKPIDMKQPWQKMEDFPLASSGVSAMTSVEAGTRRYFYYLVGSTFYRYDEYANMTTKLASPLVTPTNFVSLRYSKFGGTIGRVIASPLIDSLRIGGLNKGLYDGYKILITSGAGAGQSRTITSTSTPIKVEQGLATVASTTSIGDSTKKWKINQWAGYSVRLTYGIGQTQVREVLYNDTTTLYFSDANYQALDAFSNTPFTVSPSSTAGSQTHFVIEYTDITLDSAWTVQPDYTSKFKIESGGLWLFTSQAAAPFASIQYYDEIADMWINKTFPTNIVLSAFATDGSMERTGEIGGIYKTGTATSGGTYTITDTLATMTPDNYNNFRVRIVSGTGVGQNRRILRNSATTIETARKWDITPDNTSVYEIIADKDKFYLTGNGQSMLLQYDVDSDLVLQGAKSDDGLALNLSAQFNGLDTPPVGITSGTRNATGITSVGISVAGTGYVVGEVITLATGTNGKVIVTSISTGGVVTGVSLFSAGFGYSVATFAQTVTTGVGTGFVASVTAIGVVCNVVTSVNHNFKIGDVVKIKGDANYGANYTIIGTNTLTSFDFVTASAGSMVASASNSATLIVDCTKNWTVNEHVGKIIQTHLVGIAGAVQPRVITANTATTITVATITTALVNGTGRYIIVDQSMFGRDEQYKDPTKANVGVASSGSTTTLVDTSKNWNVNQWAGARLRIKAGTGRDAYLTITSNTATTLTYATQTFTPDTTTMYIIQDCFGTCTGVGSTTTLVDTTKNWAVNQWAGKRVRITGGAGFGLTASANEILILSNTSNTLTFTAITGLAPDATTTYTILSTQARGAGIELIWLFGGTSAGKYLVSPRGGNSNTFDKYDITKETFEYGFYIQPQTDVFGAGSYYAYDGDDTIYMSPAVATGAVQYVSYFNVNNNKVYGFGAVPTIQGAGVIGNRMEIITSGSGIDYLYFVKNSGTELYRAPIWFSNSL